MKRYTNIDIDTALKKHRAQTELKNTIFKTVAPAGFMVLCYVIFRIFA